jgi:hypothetical protein
MHADPSHARRPLALDATVDYHQPPIESLLDANDDVQSASRGGSQGGLNGVVIPIDQHCRGSARVSG